MTVNIEDGEMQTTDDIEDSGMWMSDDVGDGWES